MPEKSFLEILGDQIRQDLLADLDSTKCSPDTPDFKRVDAARFDSTYAFIQPDLGDLFAKKPGTGKNPYRKEAATAKPTQSSQHSHSPAVGVEVKVEPRLNLSQLSPAALLASEFFARQRRPLKTPLTLSHLKTCFRQLALELHPDRFAHQAPELQKQKGELFRSLRGAYDTLKEELLREL